MFAPHVSPIMIGHSFEDDTATVYSGKRVMREKKILKGRWEQGKWGQYRMWTGDKDKLVSNKSTVVTK